MTKRNRTRGGKKPVAQYPRFPTGTPMSVRMQRHRERMDAKAALRNEVYEHMNTQHDQLLFQPNLSVHHPNRRAYNRRVDPMPFSQVYG